MIDSMKFLAALGLGVFLIGCRSVAQIPIQGFLVPEEAVVVDLTHSLDGVLERIDATDYFELERPVMEPSLEAESEGGEASEASEESSVEPIGFRLGVTAGTYFQSPAATIRGQPGVGRINPSFFVAPLVLIDVRPQVAANPDYEVKIQDLTDWMDRFGEFPAGAVVVIQTGWSLRWGRLDETVDPPKNAYLSPDSDGFHYPGIHMDAVRFLVDSGIDIQGIAIDTATIQRGLDVDSVEIPQYFHRAGIWTAAKLTNLERLPPTEAVLWVAPLKVDHSGSAPARIMALVPR